MQAEEALAVASRNGLKWGSNAGTNMAWMYILKCSDGTYYVGSATELAFRIREHEDGMGSRYTARRRPVELVYSCEFASIVQAYEAENQVKGWSRAKKEALMREDWDLLPKLSERRVKNR